LVDVKKWVDMKVFIVKLLWKITRSLCKGTHIISILSATGFLKTKIQYRNMMKNNAMCPMETRAVGGLHAPVV